MYWTFFTFPSTFSYFEAQLSRKLNTDTQILDMLNIANIVQITKTSLVSLIRITQVKITKNPTAVNNQLCITFVTGIQTAELKVIPKGQIIAKQMYSHFFLK